MIPSFEQYSRVQEASLRLGNLMLPVLESRYGQVFENTETTPDVSEEMTKEFMEMLAANPDLDEGFFSSLLGGAAGFVIGPTIGGVIARALGVEKGVLYDLFTSRLVGTALGSAIARHLASQKS